MLRQEHKRRKTDKIDKNYAGKATKAFSGKPVGRQASPGEARRTLHDRVKPNHRMTDRDAASCLIEQAWITNQNPAPHVVPRRCQTFYGLRIADVTEMSQLWATLLVFRRLYFPLQKQNGQLGPGWTTVYMGLLGLRSLGAKEAHTNCLNEHLRGGYAVVKFQ